jgi:prolyl-tRNA editing enzyme YbaK/EbsC (Cys-tRNA(Pro) deacylase)
MTLEAVRAFILEHAPDIEIVALDRDSTTSVMAAAWNISPAQVAKTLCVRIGEQPALIVACGDSRLDNRKVKAALGGKVKLLPPDETAALTGHLPGGVCPFALATPMPVYFDRALKAYGVVVPAAGSPRAAMRIDPIRFAELVGARWVDLCQ